MLVEPAVLALSLAYLGLLFAVAYFGDRYARDWSRNSVAPVVYGLSLAIYCTSWTFYGAVGRAATSGIDFILIYTGPVLVVTLGYPMLAKMVRLAKQHNVTSIADFLASRYGKSRAVGVTATLFATVGVLPYIALQLQAVSSSFRTIAAPLPWSGDARGVVHADTSLIVAALMALFTILFGVRNVQASEQHRGMMLAIAFESVVKLLALLAVGPFVVWFLFDGPADMIGRLAEVPAVAERLTREASPLTWVVMSLLSGMAFLCLPRQFHVAVVEHDHPASLRTARWLFPAYLVLINLFVIPIAAAGLLLLGPSVSPDLYVLQLPLVGGESWLSAFVFIGGLSAATSMVIVACMALSGMIGNELLMPYLLRRQAGVARDMGPLVVLVRRAAVVLILMAGYAYERIISGYLPLASIGLISFCAVANFAPGLVLGLYWQRAHRFGVVAGLIGGFVVWLYALLLPTLRQGGGSGAGAGPMAPLGPFLPEPLAALDPVLQGFLVCIAVNTALLVGVSLLVRPVGRDREQADAFVLGAEPPPLPRRAPADAARIEELRQLLARFVGVERAARALSGDLSLEAALVRTERMLSGTLGAASARVIVAASARRGRLLPRSARAIIDEASEAIRYNYEILRNTLDHVGMGIASFDREGRLEIFNDRFTDLLALDDDAVAVGAAPREFGAAPDVIALLRRPEAPATHEITTRDGRVIELRLDPLPEDGFVATCNDVTARVRIAQALRDSDGQLRRAAETLEQRVAERTAELEASRAEAEAANLGKTRFIAAASHDLLQPLHAARLFTAAMIDRDPRNDLGGKIDASLGAVESLLDALLDISKLDAGAFKPEKRTFALQPLFESLATAFAPMAARRGVELVVVPTRAFVDTDPAFLRRILQNLLSNALRYGQVEGRPARVLLGCRRVTTGEGSDSLRIEVRDNGPGIAPDKQAVIFDEFVRLQPEDEGLREERGLGLGLAIVDRIARMLDLPVALASAPGRGSTFSVTVPRVAAVVIAPSAAPVPQLPPSIETESFVLCLDNEAQVREAMAALLGGWGCIVATAASQAEALAAVARAGRLPDLVLADLHLDEGADGLDAVVAMRATWGRAVPAALVTADRDPMLRLRARARQVELLHKPVKPASLRALLRLRSSAAGRLTA
ncbi:hybrid sensor histidine kinase/response regulator [Reyranella aquatilis]|uniref:histidine kinase n=1 Tax=Reyranella aquatilis TaxID=2035356 RepID=A0ABS8KRI1_9HYPH|nr:ATP-binding protein [Reyranella aquatilis]MCC8428685.1 hybrid sensor histidine kinase/response regulator [Reyranella aquatilis]